MTKQSTAVTENKMTPFYSKYYTYLSAFHEDEWVHGTTEKELKAEFNYKFGEKDAFDAFLALGGVVEFPIYGKPVGNGSMWVEDAKSAEKARARVDELNEVSRLRLEPISQHLQGSIKEKLSKIELDKLLIFKSMENMGDVGFKYFTDNIAAALLEAGADEFDKHDRFIDACDAASALAICAIANKNKTEDYIREIAEIATIGIINVSTQTSKLLDDVKTLEIVSKAFEAGKISVSEIAKMEIYGQTFIAESKNAYCSADLIDDMEERLLSDFTDTIKENGSVTAIMNAATTECHRIAKK